jgi:hypothetical protein
VTRTGTEADRRDSHSDCDCDRGHGSHSSLQTKGFRYCGVIRTICKIRRLVVFQGLAPFKFSRRVVTVVSVSESESLARKKHGHGAALGIVTRWAQGRPAPAPAARGLRAYGQSPRTGPSPAGATVGCQWIVYPVCINLKNKVRASAARVESPKRG